MAHGGLGAFYTHSSLSAKTVHLGSMRHRAPYATTSTNQTKPGRSGYLRGVLCVLRQSAAPLGAHMAAAQSRRNLAISGGISRLPDCGEIAQLPCGPLEVQPTSGARTALPGDIRNGRVRSDSLKWPRMALSGACYQGAAFSRRWARMRVNIAPRPLYLVGCTSRGRHCSFFSR